MQKIKLMSAAVRSAAVTAVMVSLGACTTAPKEPVALVVPPSYAELMATADEAQKAGTPDKALASFERAAKTEPANKLPWLKMAQLQFDARNYGASITASQEVLVRDTTDVTAKSIMAASGLRVSALALDQLRAADALGGSTRDEAQSLARTMRDALGESILPPPPVAEVPANAARKKRVVPKKPEAAAVAQPKAPSAAEANSSGDKPKRNPFDALKG